MFMLCLQYVASTRHVARKDVGENDCDLIEVRSLYLM